MVSVFMAIDFISCGQLLLLDFFLFCFEKKDFFCKIMVYCFGIWTIFVINYYAMDHFLILLWLCVVNIVSNYIRITCNICLCGPIQIKL